MMLTEQCGVMEREGVSNKDISYMCAKYRRRAGTLSSRAIFICSVMTSPQRDREIEEMEHVKRMLDWW